VDGTKGVDAAWGHCQFRTIITSHHVTNSYVSQHRNYCTVQCTVQLCRCWFGGRKGIRPVKTEWWGACMVICLGRGADGPADATATDSLAPANPDWFYLSLASLPSLS